MVKDTGLLQRKGYFIVLEGLDGSGTTTQTARLGARLFETDKSVVSVLTREPTMFSPQGQEIRRRLSGKLHPDESLIDDPAYWATLFVRDRFYHVETVVRPNVERGLTVISDRHLLSTLAYQSAQGKPMEELWAMHRGLLRPDLTLFLEVPVELALERLAGNRESAAEYFDSKIDLFRRVEGKYRRAIEFYGSVQNVVLLDGTQSIDDVAQAVWKEVEQLRMRKDQGICVNI